MEVPCPINQLVFGDVADEQSLAANSSCSTPGLLGLALALGALPLLFALRCFRENAGTGLERENKCLVVATSPYVAIYDARLGGKPRDASEDS